MFYNGAKKEAIERLKDAQKSYNKIGQEGNDCALRLYESRKKAASAIDRIEKYVNTLANTPKEFMRDVADVKLKIQDFNEAVRIERENSANNIKGASMASGGILAGSGVAVLGPTAAMAIATTFGTASTGAAIASLSGAAATNAALAWLGGGALAAGGGGMAAGNALLALAGPIGWGIAGVLIVGGGALASSKNKKAAEDAHNCAIDIEKKISVLEPKVKKLQLLFDRTEQLRKSLEITSMVNLYPNDYSKFTVEQKQVLGTLINNTKTMGLLINKKIS